MLIQDEVLQSRADLSNLNFRAAFSFLAKLFEGPTFQVTFFPQSFLQFLHHLSVPPADLLVVDNGLGVVHPDDAACLSLHGLGSFPWLVDELRWHSGQLGQIFPDVNSLGVNLTPGINKTGKV